MIEMWQLDYGYKVRVLEGKNKDKIGWVVYGSDLGHICINTAKIPKDNSYSLSEFPSNLEILSTDNPYKIKPTFTSDLSNFAFARLSLLIENPKKVLINRQYFSEDLIRSARRSLFTNIVLGEI